MHATRKAYVSAVATLCAGLVLPGFLFPQIEHNFTPEQLQSLVAPVALYPDALLAQVLAASTYPLETLEATQWLQQNGDLQGPALVEAAAEQQWDPSIQALVVFPAALQGLSRNLRWTTALGNAFLAQPPDVMNAVQVMRQKAYADGTLQSNSQQLVDVRSESGQTIVKIEPTDPQVVYLPAYDPAVVYGPPPGPASAISFGTGIALGEAFQGCCVSGGWGWGFNWGGTGITVNNTFVNRYGLSATPYATMPATSAWAHNPAYRGAVPYSSVGVAERYGVTGAARTTYGTAAREAGPIGGTAIPTPYSSAGAFARGGGSEWARSSSARGNGSMARSAGGLQGRR